MKLLTKLLTTFLCLHSLLSISQCDVVTGALYIANSLVIDAYPSGTSPFSYAWNNGSTGSSLIVNTPGTYCVTVTDAYGCVDSSCYTYAYTTNCQAQIFEYDIFTVTGLIASPIGTPPYTYQWDTHPDDTLQILPADSTGVYCVSITDANGCLATSCYFFNKGQTNSCSVTIQQSQIPLYPATLYADVNTNNGSGATFSWNTGDTGSFITVYNPGFYCVTANYPSGCSYTDCYYYDTAGTNIDCLAGYLKYYNPEFYPNTIYLINVSHGDSLSYQWEFGDGGVSGLEYPTHYYNTFGKYFVKLSISDPSGCTSVFGDSLGLDANGNLLRNGFTINVVDEAPDPVSAGMLESINDLLEPQIYPNPFSDYFSIEWTAYRPGNFKYKIYNLMGSLITQKDHLVIEGHNVIQIDASSFEAGVYFVELDNGKT
ncbi:MAG: PKD domain-containing protein, partial [Flavobacteriales bacterium]|nr:PKD domain-containing protein [Flavobacteriales bacterium]